MVLVPDEVAQALGGLKQMRVVGTMNGVPYQSSTMPYGGRGLFMGVHKATRAAAAVEFGDTVQVTVARDDRPRVLEIPPELEAAFVAQPQLRERFEGLSFSRRKDLAVLISEAKLPQTRVVRLEKAVTQLRALPGPGR